MRNGHGLRFGALLLPAFLAATATGCATPAATADVESQEQAAVSDIASATARGDGSFDVTCRDGRSEVVTATDVEAGRVCSKPAPPASPFAAGACTGTPMTEAGARARLAAGTGSSVTVGSYVLALRRRDTAWVWTGTRWDSTNRWVDAPEDRLAAWRETESEASRGERAVFSSRGSVELAADASGAPYLRLVGEAANEVGPDRTRFMRLVTRPMTPWASLDYPVGPTFALEAKREGGPWQPVTEYGWSVQTSEYELGSKHRSWYFGGGDMSAIVTERCGQLISVQSLGGLSSVRAAIGISIVLD